MKRNFQILHRFCPLFELTLLLPVCVKMVVILIRGPILFVVYSICAGALKGYRELRQFLIRIERPVSNEPVLFVLVACSDSDVAAVSVFVGFYVPE